MRIESLLLIVIVALSGACTDQGEPSAQDSPRTAAVPAPRAPAPRTNVSLAESLRAEADNRPSQTPTPEQVFAALRAMNIDLRGPRQYLASTVGASFCMGGRVSDTLATAVCEYPDADAAERGRAMSLERFAAAAPHRQIVVNRKTTLTLSSATTPLQKDDTARRIVRSFQEL